MANEYVSKVVLANGEVLIDLTGDSVDAAHLLKGYTAHDKAGAPIAGACTFDSDTSEDTAAVGEVLEGRTFHARGAALAGTMKNNGAVSLKISAKDDAPAIPQGYHDGSGSAGIADTEKAKLIPANIRQGVTVLGVVGTMSGSEGVNAQEKSVTPTFAAQVIVPDDGYTHLSEVNVAPITVIYSDNSAGGKTVTIGVA